MKPILLTAVLLTMFGCASVNRSNSDATTADPRGVTIFRGGGEPAAWADVVKAASGADAVLVGENHGHPLGLASCAALWQDLLAAGGTPALAMEFFERDEQAGLDDYLGGLTDEAAFRKATGRTDGSYPPGHKAMVEAAKAGSRPVIAANAPRRYVRIARTDGYDKLSKLTDEQRRLFRVPDELPTGTYRENFDKIMTENAADPKHGPAGAPAKDEATRLDSAFRSQSLWDWTMADSVSRCLGSGMRPTMLVIGRFHIDQQGGTVLALRKMAPGARIVTVSYVNEWSWALRDEDRDRADFVVYVGPQADEQ